MFQQSDKVVCVNASGAFSNPTIDYSCAIGTLQKGVIYDVRDVYPMYSGLYITGIVAGHWQDGEEASFHTSRFRKLTDIQAENELARTLVASNGESL